MRLHITSLSYIEREQIIDCLLSGILSVRTREVIVDFAQVQGVREDLTLGTAHVVGYEPRARLVTQIRDHR